MGFIVKNTTKCQIGDLLCPHYCRGCGRLGEVLCSRCKKNLKLAQNFCPKCHNVANERCADCKIPFEKFYMCNWKDSLLGDLAKSYKYQSIRALTPVFVELLEQLPFLKKEKNLILVPLPTTNLHIRERSLDHTYKIAHKLAKRNHLKCQKIISRKNNSVQVGKAAKERWQQAKESYEIIGKLDKNATYVLFDDVWTTGASMCEAAKLMRKCGAKRIIGLVLVVSR